MESIPRFGKEEDTVELPPGFRFHPTDEELISHYLSPKVLDCSFNAMAIGEADLNKSEPWDLPWKAKMGEREWYFFCVRDRKYPTGMRTNRATDAGYWKATGKDKEVHRGQILVGMKKTLVFYKGRAPKGEKTDWVMHEYRLEGQFSIPRNTQNEWVICRVFQKSSGGKKTPISALIRCAPSILPPLMEAGGDVTCFSGPEDVKPAQNCIIKTNTNIASSSSSFILSKQNQQIITPCLQNNSVYAPNLEYPESIFAQDQSALRMLCEDSNKNISGQNLNRGMVMVGSSKDEFSPEGISTDISSVVSNLDMVQRSFEDPDEPSTSGALVDLDSLWNY